MMTLWARHHVLQRAVQLAPEMRWQASLLYGEPGVRLAEEAHRVNASALVAGVYHAAPAFGRTIEYLLHVAACPVLLVRVPDPVVGSASAKAATAVGALACV